MCASMTDAEKVAVWDLPTRLFHWLLVSSVATAAWSAGQDRQLDIHVYAGYVTLGLLGFRVLWGFLGGRYARFADFVYGPAAVRRFLHELKTGNAPTYLGHNPAGSWAIFAILALLLLIGVTGLLVLGGEEGHGPLAGWGGIGAGVAIHEVHQILAHGLYLLIAVHLAGVLVESFLHRQNLAAAMVSGKKNGRSGGPATKSYSVVGLFMVAIVAGSVFLYFKPWLEATKDSPYRPFVGKALPRDQIWQETCGECHQAYHPVLLPTRSWERLLAEQQDHFGEDLYLDESVIAALREFARRHSAQSGLTEAGWRIAHSLAAGDTPRRITETPYWKLKHRDIAEAAWGDPKVGSKANCAACHLDAEDNIFEDAAMRLPTVASSLLPKQRK